jgi:hypothetical protein
MLFSLENFSLQRLFAGFQEQSAAMLQRMDTESAALTGMFQRLSGQIESLRKLASPLSGRGVEWRLADSNFQQLARFQTEVSRRQELGRAFERVCERQRQHLHAVLTNVLTMAENLAGAASPAAAWQLLRRAAATHGYWPLASRRRPSSVSMGDTEDREEEEDDEDGAPAVGLDEELPGWAGGHVVLQGARQPVARGTVLAPGSAYVRRSAALPGLLLPAAGTQLLLHDGRVVPMPEDVFVHPTTARVLPMDGNVAMSGRLSSLVVLTEAAAEGTEKHRDLVPYISCPTVMDSAEALLPCEPVPGSGRMRLLQPVRERHSGLLVPTLGCTLDRARGQLVPLGGMYTSPVTQMPAPIELGAPLLLDGQVCPIIGIALDASGRVVPLAALSAGSEPLIRGDRSVDAWARVPVTVAGLRLDQASGEVQPTAGDAVVLATSRWLEGTAALLRADRQLSQQAWQTARLRAAQRLDHLVQTLVAELARVRLWHAMARELASTGGVLGHCVRPATGEQLPVLAGLELDDAHSGLRVPVLGAVHDARLGCVPLAGAMRDAGSGRLVPIAIGAEFFNGTQTVRCAGARFDAHEQQVLPSEARCATTLHPAAQSEQQLQLLDREIHARQFFWGITRQHGARISELLQEMGRAARKAGAVWSDVCAQLQTLRDALGVSAATLPPHAVPAELGTEIAGLLTTSDVLVRQALDGARQPLVVLADKWLRSLGAVRSELVPAAFVADVDQTEAVLRRAGAALEVLLVKAQAEALASREMTLALMQQERAAASPLAVALERFAEAMLQRGARLPDGGAVGQSASHVLETVMERLDVIEALALGQEERPVWSDPRERCWSNTAAAPVPVAPGELSTLELAVFQFGTVVQEVLMRNLGVAPVRVSLASNLPASDSLAAGNMFGSSYVFDQAARHLQVRRERCDTVGEYTLVLLHALAHIAVGRMERDADDDFVDTFFRFLRCVCQELFSLYVSVPNPSLLASSTDHDLLSEVMAAAQSTERAADPANARFSRFLDALNI